MEKIVTVDDKIHTVISDHRFRFHILVSYFEVIVKRVSEHRLKCGGEFTTPQNCGIFYHLSLSDSEA